MQMQKPTAQQATISAAVIALTALIYTNRSSLFSAACVVSDNFKSTANTLFGIFSPTTPPAPVKSIDNGPDSAPKEEGVSKLNPSSS
jgi:hypothetical protein